MKVSWDDEIPNIWKIKHVPNHQPAYCLVGVLVSKTLISCVCWIVKLLVDPFDWLAYCYQTLSLVVDVEQSSCWLILLFGWFVDFKPYQWFQLSLNLPPRRLCVTRQSIDTSIAVLSSSHLVDGNWLISFSGPITKGYQSQVHTEPTIHPPHLSANLIYPIYQIYLIQSNLIDLIYPTYPIYPVYSVYQIIPNLSI